MLKWLSYYRVGENIKNPERIRRKIESGKAVPEVWLLTLSDNPGNILEMFPAVLMVQEPFARLCPPIIGMTKGKKAAVQMAVEIITEVYGATGGFDVREYFGSGL